MLQHAAADCAEGQPVAVLRPSLFEPIPTVKSWIGLIKERKLTADLLRHLGECEFAQLLPHVKRVKRDPDGTSWVFLWPCRDEETDTQVMETAALYPWVFRLEQSSIPAKPPLTRAQFDQCQAIWPVSFHENKELELTLKGRAFDCAELEYIHSCMRKAIDMAKASRSDRGKCVAAVLADPTSQTIVCCACDQRMKAPLAHAAMMAIENLASVQRASNLPSRSRGENYLCTNLDAFISAEPCVMCSMALLHSRIRRVFFAIPDANSGGLGGRYYIHNQGLLNHQFEAYRCKMHDEGLMCDGLELDMD